MLLKVVEWQMQFLLTIFFKRGNENDSAI